MQSHSHTLRYANGAGTGVTWGLFNAPDLGGTTSGGISSARNGNTTRTKQKGVKYIIKVL